MQFQGGEFTGTEGLGNSCTRGHMEKGGVVGGEWLVDGLHLGREGVTTFVVSVGETVNNGRRVRVGGRSE